MIGVLTAKADGYSYLTFETTEGAKVSVAASGLTITVSGTTLTTGSQTFTISNLSKMYFTTTDESTTGIEAVTNATLDEATEIYDLSGKKIVNRQSPNSRLPHGAYIVKTNGKTYKLVVK